VLIGTRRCWVVLGTREVVLAGGGGGSCVVWLLAVPMSLGSVLVGGTSKLTSASLY
jgi:hypothetical protein